MSVSKDFHLTEEDIRRYEVQIEKIDFAVIPLVLEKVPDKLEAILRSGELNEFQVQLINDISRLYTLMKKMPDLSADLKRRILFALQYFLEDEDEIPDSVPGIGFLDDAVLVRWVVDQILVEYAEFFQA